jgi:CBS domain-containing protein
MPPPPFRKEPPVPTIQELLAEKGSQVLTIGAEADVQQAAQVMNEHKVGCLVVTERGRVVGIFTERDVLQRIVAERRDPASTPVGQVMSPEVVCARPDTDLDEARAVFKNRRIRHLPVVGPEGNLLGLVSIGDLNAYQTSSQEYTIHFLHEYIYGRT